MKTTTLNFLMVAFYLYLIGFIQVYRVLFNKDMAKAESELKINTEENTIILQNDSIFPGSR